CCHWVTDRFTLKSACLLGLVYRARGLRYETYLADISCSPTAAKSAGSETVMASCTLVFTSLGSWLRGARLRGARLRGARLRGAWEKASSSGSSASIYSCSFFMQAKLRVSSF